MQLIRDMQLAINQGQDERAALRFRITQMEVNRQDIFVTRNGQCWHVNPQRQLLQNAGNTKMYKACLWLHRIRLILFSPKLFFPDVKCCPNPFDIISCHICVSIILPRAAVGFELEQAKRELRHPFYLRLGTSFERGDHLLMAF